MQSVVCRSYVPIYEYIVAIFIKMKKFHDNSVKRIWVHFPKFEMTFAVTIMAFALVSRQTEGQIIRVEPDDVICLGCICEAMSDCNQTLTCTGDSCGAFFITLGYWIDAGRIVLDSNADDPNDPMSYKRCAMNPNCAGATVKAYLRKFMQDCNRDGVINCYDYAHIHKFGGYGCVKNYDSGFDVLDKCIKHVNRIQQASSRKP